MEQKYGSDEGRKFISRLPYFWHDWHLFFKTLEGNNVGSLCSSILFSHHLFWEIFFSLLFRNPNGIFKYKKANHGTLYLWSLWCFWFCEQNWTSTHLLTNLRKTDMKMHCICFLYALYTCLMCNGKAIYRIPFLKMNL